jgi:hypothetical protein
MGGNAYPVRRCHWNYNDKTKQILRQNGIS